MTLANRLTLARGGMAFLTFACLWAGGPLLTALALVLYLLAMLTDLADGIIARKTHSTSSFGALADPLADKVLILGALIAFTRIPGLDVPAWAVFLMIARELVMGGLRALAALQRKVLAADLGGKWKMAVQSVSVLLILCGLCASFAWGPFPWLAPLSFFLTLLSLLFSLASAAAYLYRSKRLLKESWEASQPPS